MTSQRMRGLEEMALLLIKLFLTFYYGKSEVYTKVGRGQ